MTVMQILDEKGREVYTLEDSQVVTDAVTIMNEHNVGALVVTNEAGDVSGIISERDIMRQLSNHPQSVMSLSIAKCMTPNPFTLGKAATVDDVMNLMSSKRIRHLPIVENKKLVGIVSIGDVVKRQIADAESEREALKEYIAG